MSMSVGSHGADEPLNEMNTTPLIDVMLVLLVMFIITLPIQTHAVKIDLPVAQDVNNPNPVEPDKNKVTIAANGVIAWNGVPTDLVGLDQYLQATKGIEPEPELQVQPDPQAQYLVVDKVMAVVKRSGVGKLGFVGNEQYARVF